MPIEIGRPPPLEDWEKALLLIALIDNTTPRPKSYSEVEKWLARLTDWPLNRAQEAVAEAHLRGMIEPEKSDAD